MSSTTPRAIGPYEVIRELGRGGMGLVLEVLQPDTGRALALKLITGNPGEQALRRFQREAQLLARVQHPHVLRVYGFAESPHGPFILTDLVEGQDLEVCVKMRGAFPPREAARIVRAVADAIAAVHAQGIVHRDLKPQNVILRPDGEPVLLDFGLARDEHGERLTLSGAFLGTPAFMAPEQTGSREDVGTWTDVYALGALLLYLLAGRPPYGDGLATPVIVKKLLTEEPIWPARDRPQVPAALDAICRRAMAREPGARYPDAAALRAALDEVLGGHETSPGARRGKGPALLGLTGALVLALVAGGVAWSRRGSDPAPGPAGPAPVASRAPVEGAGTPPDEHLASWPERRLDGPLAVFDPRETSRGPVTLTFLPSGEALYHASGSRRVHLLTLSRAGIESRPLDLPVPAAAVQPGREGRIVAAVLRPGGAQLLQVDPTSGVARGLTPETPLESELCAALAVDPASGVVVCAGFAKEAERSSLLVYRPGAEPVTLPRAVKGEVAALALQEGGARLLAGWGFNPQDEGDKLGAGSEGGVVRFDLTLPQPAQSDEFRISTRGTGQCVSLLAFGSRVMVGDSGTFCVHVLDGRTLRAVDDERQPVAKDIRKDEVRVGAQELGIFGRTGLAAHRAAVVWLVGDAAGRLWSVSGDEVSRAENRNRERGNEVRVWSAEGQPLGGLLQFQRWARAVAVDVERELALLVLTGWDGGPSELQLWHADAFLEGLRPAPGSAASGAAGR